MMAQQSGALPTAELVDLIKDGQRNGGQPFKQRWWTYCDQGWAGTRDYDPSHHPQDALAQFVAMCSMEYAHEAWFRKHFKDLPELPPLPPVPPGPPAGPPGMPPLPPGAPGMPPGFPFPNGSDRGRGRSDDDRHRGSTHAKNEAPPAEGRDAKEESESESEVGDIE